MRTDRDYADSMELVEAVMEWIGMRWTVSMIKRELREFFGDDLSFKTCNYLIKAANAEIRKRFNINPQDYKGIQITFYESIIRNRSEKTKNQLTAAERLDKLFGLEQVSSDDPEILARKIRDALKEMDESIEDKQDGDKQGSTNGGDGKNETGDDGNDRINKNENTTIEGDETSKENLVIEDDNIPFEVIEEVRKIDNKDLKRFRKKKE